MVHSPGGGIQLLVFGGVYDVNISHADSGEVKARHKQLLGENGWMEGDDDGGIHVGRGSLCHVVFIYI